ncbi:MAG: hypothetical protein CV087_07495 [Candidatus Brocadia sp. WS118]|nr:MAG: hypothetical protein CV087_07495 [Candidatus Brocadia sp. WS118]
MLEVKTNFSLYRPKREVEELKKALPPAVSFNMLARILFLLYAKAADEVNALIKKYGIEELIAENRKQSTRDKRRGK